jgi:hypothetical protein
MIARTLTLPPGDGGGARRIRTDDILLAKQALYQLSYGPLNAPQTVPSHACKLSGQVDTSSEAALASDGRPGQT